MPSLSLPVRLVGDGIPVPCVDGLERPYLSCDAAASTAPLPAVLSAVEEFLPWYSSVHRGAGYKSQRSTDAYEAARHPAGERALHHTRAQALLARNDDDGRALREVFSELISNRTTARSLARLIESA